MIPFKINDQEVEAQEGWTVLETAKRYGIPIPTLCYHEALAPHGACRLCIVEAEGPGLRRQVISSCTLQVSDGLLVETHSPLVEKCRRVIFELLLGRSPEARPLIQMAKKYGVNSTRFPTDQNDNCVRCALCVRVCRDTIGASALCFAGRGQKKRVTAEFGQLSETCIGCGTCTNLCPTEAIRLEDRGDSRRIFLKENTISRLPLVPCRRCGVLFQTAEFIEYARTQSDIEGATEIPRDLCPACARRVFAEAVIGETLV